MRMLLFVLLLVSMLTSFSVLFVEGGTAWLLYTLDFAALGAAMLIVVKSVRVVIPDAAVIAKLNVKKE